MEPTSVLVCLPPDEAEADRLLAAATRLAEDLRAPLSIVQVYPARWPGRTRPLPAAWTLNSDTPQAAIARFARRRRFTHVVL